MQFNKKRKAYICEFYMSSSFFYNLQEQEKEERRVKSLRAEAKQAVKFRFCLIKYLQNDIDM